MSSQRPRILIVGGGIAGFTLAYWLAQSSFDITIIERSSRNTRTGQGIDITGTAIEVVSKMGVEDEIRSKTTEEGGFALVNDRGELVAALGVGEDTATLTREIEIMRADLTNVLGTAAKAYPHVTYREGCSISAIDQRPGSKTVSVTLTDSEPAKVEEFDLVVGADGVRSRTRGLAFDASLTESCIQMPAEIYASFFSIPAQREDRPYSRMQHAPDGRAVLIRPLDDERSMCYMTQCAHSPALQAVLGTSTEEQKAAITETFASVKDQGIIARALRGLAETENFYFDQAAQIKLPRGKWHSGRVGLVGDAAYAPSGLTGQGTSLAIIGAYVLAGELASSRDDLVKGLVNYENRLYDYIKEVQNIPLGGRSPRLLNPLTSWGIWTLRTAFWLLEKSGLWRWINPTGPKAFKLPDYTWTTKSS